ncbi:MAG: serine hydrolase domain-containing protein [Chitinophagaceae bacterium]
MKLNQPTLDKIVAQTASKKNIHGVVLHVKSADNSINLASAVGNLQTDSPFYIASINKMMITALTLQLVQQGRLPLQDKAAQYLPPEIIDGIHVFKGVDYSSQITIQQLLTHTSGLPCYLISKTPDGKKNMQALLAGEDQSWPLQKMVSEIKTYPIPFAPGTPGKAAYSETNFRLLGKILQTVTGRPVNVLLTELFAELGMQHTYVLPGAGSPTPPVYYKAAEIKIDNYAASTGHDVVSTAHDLMLFVTAFFNGRFYPKEELMQLQQWNRIFFPLQYGTGLQLFSIPRILSPFRAIPKLIGHSGSVGSAAFYAPQKGIFITGTIAQAASPNILFQAMVKVLAKL